MALGALLAALLSQVIGFPVFRLRVQDHFAIATIAVGEIVQTIVINWDAVGGARGLFVPIKRPDSFLNFQFHESKQTYYYIALALLVLAVGISRSIAPLPHRLLLPRHPGGPGRGRRARDPGGPLQAARDGDLGGPDRAGRDVLRPVRLLDRPRVGASAVPLDPRLPGGGAGRVGTLWGPILGAAILVPLGEVTRVQFGGTGKALDLVIYGLLIMIVSVVPGGIMALLERGSRRS